MSFSVITNWSFKIIHKNQISKKRLNPLFLQNKKVIRKNFLKKLTQLEGNWCMPTIAQLTLSPIQEHPFGQTAEICKIKIENIKNIIFLCFYSAYLTK
jgi:hypothetical protein